MLRKLVAHCLVALLALLPPVQAWAAVRDAAGSPPARQTAVRARGPLAGSPPARAASVGIAPSSLAQLTPQEPQEPAEDAWDPTARACDDVTVTQLTLRYVGKLAGARVQVKGTDAGPAGSIPLFDGVLQPDELFTLVAEASAQTLPAEIRLSVDGVMNAQFQTGCAKSLRPGLARGAFEIVAGLRQQDGLLQPLLSSWLEADQDYTLATDVAPAGVGAGDTLRYRVKVRNRSPFTLLNLRFAEPPGRFSRLVVGSVTTTQGTVTVGNAPGDTLADVSLGTLGRLAEATIRFDVRIDDPLPASVAEISAQGVLWSTRIPAVLTDDAATPQPADPTVATVGQRSRLEAFESSALVLGHQHLAWAQAEPDVVRYAVTIRNAGLADATSVVFTDTPGAHTTLAPGSVETTQGTVTSGNGSGDTSVNVELGILPAGAVATVRFRAVLADPLPADVVYVSNQGRVTSFEEPLGEPTDDVETIQDDDATRTVVALRPLLDAIKTDVLVRDSDRDGQVSPGDVLRYVVVLNNRGLLPAAQVQFGDAPDASTLLVNGSVATSQGQVQGGNGQGDATVAVSIGPLLWSWLHSVTVAFDVTVGTPAPGQAQLSNQGTVSAHDQPPVPTDDPLTFEPGDATLTPLPGAAAAGVGDRVWNDLDGDGLQDPGEPGLAGVTVRLLDGGGAVVASSSTSTDGAYAFSGVAPGSYAVEFVAPSGFVFAPQDQGADDTRDSDANPASGRTGPFSLAAGASNLTVDAGLYQPGAIGDLVWEDRDADGIQDVGEGGLAGVVVRLLDAGGAVVASSSTSADGAYTFASLAPGPYAVEFVAPPGFLFAPRDQGGNDALDSDADPATGRSPLVAVAAGASVLDVDAGLFRRGSLGDRVWKDVNRNGLQDAGETGVAGVSVRLLDAGGGLLAASSTDADGAYLFPGLLPGAYVVEFVAPAGHAFTLADSGADDAADSDANPDTGRTAPVVVQSGVDDRTLDAGLYTPTTFIQSSSPANGETDVAVTRETILRFSNPLAASTTIDDQALFAEFGGQRLAGRIHLAPDRRSVTLFYDQSLPASARVRVTLRGDGLIDVFGNAVDADRDDLPGGTGTLDFDTLTLTTMPGTAVCGRVFASELAPGDPGGSVNVPLEGVVVSADGAEATLRAVTDSAGNFCLDPAPLGQFFVHIDGRTATNPVPLGDYYPFVGKQWESEAGRVVNVGSIYLPKVVAGTLQPVSQSAPTVITFPPSVLAQFPHLQGVEIVVPADSLYSDDGSRGGLVGIAPVPPDRLPGPPPPGLEFPLVITVQTDGPSNFDVPVPACFPNLPDPGLGVPLPPGTKNALYSFNHDTGKWEHVGPMTVTADGLLICTDPGEGILAPGWHGSGPPPNSPPPPPGPPPPNTPPPPPPDDCPTRCAKKLQIDNKACEKTFAIESAALTAVYIAALILCAFSANPVCIIAAVIAHKIALAAALAKFLSCKSTAQENYQFCLAGCPPLSPLDIARAEACSLHAADPPPPPDDPVVGQIMGIADQIDTLLLPHVATGSIPPAVAAQLQDLLGQANTAAGGNVESYLRTYQLGLEQGAEPLESNSHASRGNAPPYPILYHAHITRTGGDDLELRGFTAPQAQYALFVPRDGTVRYVAFYDPRARAYGVAQPRLTAGLRYRLPRAFLMPVDDTFADSDGDGLADAVELVYGTSASDSDSDDDGVSDGAEVEQGTNPLDGQPTITGVIASVDTPGTAVDVCAVNDMAAVADSTAGVIVMNVFNGMNPTAVARLDTPGTAQAVACAAGSRVAVADGTAGLALVDISDPPAASIVQQLSLGGAVQAVTAAGSVAFAGLDTGRLVALDVATGALLGEVTGLGPVHDMAVAGDVLFVALNTKLRAYGISSANFLGFLGEVNVTRFPEGVTRRRRVFAGGGYAYVTSYPGYDAIDVHDPAAMQLVGPARDSGPNSFKQIVANGSGLGIAAVGVNPRVDGTHDVWLYDVTDPTVTNTFLTVLPTPGLTRALSIYNGLAYVADGESGLQVVNYLPYDALGVAPSITLSTNYSPGLAEEGQRLRLTAAVTDDVQVRNVQFFVDGVKVLTDGNFPFEHRFVTPLIAETPSFTIQACASDTGGRRTCTAETTITLIEDATPPHVASVVPANGSRNREGLVHTVAATFSEPIETATLGATSFQVFSVGPDGLPGTPDDTLVPGGILSYRDDVNVAFLDFASALPIDRYRAVLAATITDRRGNPLPAEFAWTFLVTGPNSWVNPAGGSWMDPANWSEGVVPGASDLVNITLPGTYTVVLGGTGSVSALNIGTPGGGQTLWVRGQGGTGAGHLLVADDLLNQGTIRLESQTSTFESNLTVTSGEFRNQGTLVVGQGSGGARNLSAFLRNQGTFQVGFNASFAGTLTNEGSVDVVAGQTLSLAGSQVFNQNAGSVTGAGTLLLNGATLNVSGGGLSGAPAFLANSTLNLGPSTSEPASFIMAGPNGQVTGTLQAAQNLWVRGQATFGNGLATATGFTNLGAIRIESQTSTFESSFAGDFTNGPSGVIDVNAGTGGARRIMGVVTNRGTVNINHPTTFTGTFNHDAGSFTVAAPGSFALGAGQVFNLRGGTLAGPGSLQLVSASLNFSGGTTIGAPAFLANSTLVIGAGATAPASFIMAGAGGQVTGTLRDGQSLWVRGQGTYGNGLATATGSFTNLGAIRIESQTSTFESNFAGDFTNGDSGVIDINEGSGGVRRISGTVTNLGTVNVSHPTNFLGTFNQDGGVLAVASGETFGVGAGQVFNLRGGTIAGPGTVQLDNGTLNFSGGTTAAPVFLANSTLDIGAAATAPASFIMAGSNGHVAGTLQSGQSLWARGQGTYGASLVTATTGFTNLGAIRIESQTSTFESNLAGDFTNGPTGVIDVNNGTGGERRLSGVVTNQGALNINQPTNFTGTLNQDGGTLAVAAGQLLLLGTSQIFNLRGGAIAGPGTLQVNGGTFNFEGGTTTGAPILLSSSTLNIGAAATLPASFAMAGAGQISGNIAAGQTVWVRGQGTYGAAVLTAAADFTNAGLLRLESQTSTFESRLALPGGTLTNTGTLDIGLGTGGFRGIASNLVNQGIFRINGGTSVTLTGTQFRNEAGGVVEGAGTLMLSGATLANAGSIRPGASPGLLSVTGSIAQDPAGALDIEVGGTAPGTQYDRLAVSGPAALDGTLNLSLVGGFVPALGASFDVLTCGSRTGTFPTVNGLSIGGGLRFQVSYAANKVTLTVVPE